MGRTNLLDSLMQQLILNYNQSKDCSLYYGKMGAIICLCEYARFVNCGIYLDLVEELLDELFFELPISMSNNFATGFSGIGWGITYLISQKFVEGDSDEVLEELDSQIMSTDIARLSDMTIDTGLAGIAFYVLSRLRLNRYKQKESLPFDPNYLDSWKCLLPLLSSKETKNETDIFKCLEKYLCFSLNIENKNIDIPSFICNSDKSCLEVTRNMPIGLKDGISGIAIKMMK